MSVGGDQIRIGYSEALDWHFERVLKMADREDRSALVSGALFLWFCTVSILANLSVAESFHVNFFWIDFDVSNGFWPRISVFLSSLIAFGAFVSFSKIANSHRRTLGFFQKAGSARADVILQSAIWIRENERWLYRFFPLVGFAMWILIVALFGGSIVSLIVSFFCGPQS